jgi:hypothetical protein
MMIGLFESNHMAYATLRMIKHTEPCARVINVGKTTMETGSLESNGYHPSHTRDAELCARMVSMSNTIKVSIK